ncbi:MAG: adenylate/guanylate cyclase domain-containing protein [Actinomycetota bacterium]
MSAGALPETRYAKSGDVNIAYQVVGEGGLDLVYVPGWVSNVEGNWDDPWYSRFLDRLASFSRLILFDKRGTGLSDRVPEHGLPTLEQRMDDVRAVMDAVGSERAALFGVSEGGPMCALFAATYPDRTSALIVYGTYARRLHSEDYPWGRPPEEREAFIRDIEENWGGPVALPQRAPSAMGDERFVRWWSSYLRQSASPGAAAALIRMNMAVDVRPVLPTIGVPTLVLHRGGDLVMRGEEARYIAENVPGARLVVLPGEDHLPWVGDRDALLDEIEEFLTGMRRGPEPDRVLATVLFTDIVGSTERAAELGDRRWRDLLEDHHGVVRGALSRFRGREVDTAGDGFLATFDGPARAIRCARFIVGEVRGLGLEVRAGLHTGECELAGDDVRGIAVHIGARVAALALPGEVLVSSTV